MLRFQLFLIAIQLLNPVRCETGQGGVSFGRVVVREGQYGVRGTWESVGMSG